MNFPKIGPAVMVTAAFVGPGTVITTTLAGAHFGYALAWALLFSIFATLVLQEMAARLGIVTQQDLGENIYHLFKQPLLKYGLILMVLSAIVIGNGAYQSGNISGASLGLMGIIEGQHILGITQQQFWPIVIGIVAFFVLWQGQYQFIEKSLIFLVALMSLAFLITLFLVSIDWSAFFHGLLIPSLPDAPGGATLTVIALIGTTVVPYNLFLHTASARTRWKHPDQISEAKQDLYFSIPLGGVISIAILSAAASAYFGKVADITSAVDLAPTLEPLVGAAAKNFISIGLFAAGISSAVTAPLAAAYAMSGVLNMSLELSDIKFKIIWMLILLIGIIIASMDYKPVSIIWFAQVANGILLPLIVLILLILMNSEKLKNYRNSSRQNILGIAVFIIALILSARSLSSAFGWL